MRRIISLLSIALTLTLGSHTVEQSLHSAHTQQTTPAHLPFNNIYPLHVSHVKIPPLPVERYRTVGAYPRIGGDGRLLTRVNAALKRAVRRYETLYARAARIEERHTHLWGFFSFNSALEQVSASSIVVSALIPTNKVFPGGTGGAAWFSVTVVVPTGRQIKLLNLFARHRRGLAALADSVKRRILTLRGQTPSQRQQYQCVRRSFHFSPLGLKPLAPKSRNYRFFALTPKGLTVGFTQGQIASPVCGNPWIIVPYSAIRPYLSPLGSTLTNGTRYPANSSPRVATSSLRPISSGS